MVNKGKANEAEPAWQVLDPVEYIICKVLNASSEKTYEMKH